MRYPLFTLLLVACAPAPSDDDRPDDGEEVASLEPVQTCDPGDPCAGSSAVSDVVAGYRKDVFYPYGPGVLADDPDTVFGTDETPAYPEARIPDPVDGGRVVVVARAAADGSLVPASPIPGEVGPRARQAWSVELDGLSYEEAHDAETVDWVRVWPTTFEAGDPLWIQLHSRDPELDRRGSLQVRVPLSEGGFAIDATVALTPTPLIVESVTHDDAGTTVWVHVRNTDDRTHRLERVTWDGLDVTDAACPGPIEVGAGEPLTLRIPRCEAPEPGEAWTLALYWEDAPPSVGAGRVLRPRFPVHTWPSGGDCPLPGIHDENWRAHEAAGFDTLFVRGGYDPEDGCDTTPTAEVIPATFEDADAWAMLDEWTPLPADLSRVAARMLGDEVDTDSLEGHVAAQRMRRLAEESAWMHEDSPELPTYIGGSRHRLTAMFAGVADIQGMDFYAAACAPHITDFGVHPPLRGPYDYLRATVLNHAPGTTWLYAQGLHGGWAAQPTADDVRHAALSVVAAGGRGLMWFQTDLGLAADHPDTWEAMARVNHEIGALAPWLRQGGATGLARVDGRALVEAVRIPGGLVVPVLSLETTSGPEELACSLGTYEPWSFADTEVTVTVEIPDDVGVVEVFEVRDGGTVEPPGEVVLRDDRTATLTVPLGPGEVGRLLVLAADDALRAAVDERL